MIKSDGAMSAYYDLPKNAKTLNDLMEWKGDTHWLGDSVQLVNIFKAAWRWGTKDGTDKPYDARKLLYFSARLLMKHAGKEALNKTLRDMLDDEQFRPNNMTSTFQSGDPPGSIFVNPQSSGTWYGGNSQVFPVIKRDWRHL